MLILDSRLHADIVITSTHLALFGETADHLSKIIIQEGCFILQIWCSFKNISDAKLLATINILNITKEVLGGENSVYSSSLKKLHCL